MKKTLPFLLILLCFFCASCGVKPAGESTGSGNVAESKALVYKSAWADPDNVSVYLTSTRDTSYELILTADKELVTIKGIASPKHTAGDSVMVKDYAVKKLSGDEWKTLSDKVGNLGAFEGDDSLASDVWYALYSAGTAKYGFNYGGSVNDRYDELITLLIQYSALPVVDSQGAVLEPFTS